MNIRALIVSAVVGVLTVVLLTLYLHRLEIETSGGGPVAVLAAVKPLEPGTIITPDMVAVKRLTGCQGKWVEAETEFGLGWVDKVCGRQLTGCP